MENVKDERVSRPSVVRSRRRNVVVSILLVAGLGSAGAFVWILANRGPFDRIAGAVERDVRRHAEAGTPWLLDDSVEPAWEQVMVVHPYADPRIVKERAPEPIGDRLAERMKFDDGGTALIFFSKGNDPDLVYIGNDIVMFDIDEVEVFTPAQARFTVKRDGELTSGKPLYEARPTE